MKRKFTNVFLLVAISVAALTSFVSCKDYQDDLQIEMDIQDKALDQALQALKADLQNKIDLLDAAQKNCSTKCDSVQRKLWANFDQYYKKSETYNQTEIDSMLKDLKDWMGNVADAQTLVQLIDSAKAAAQDALEAANTAQEAANAAQEAANAAQGLAERDSVRIDVIDNALIDLRSDLKDAADLAEKALGLAQRDSVRIDELQTAFDTFSQYANETFATKTHVEEVADSARMALTMAEANELAIHNLDSIMNKVRDSLEILNLKDGILANRIDSLATETDGLKDSIADLRELAKTYLDSALNVSKQIQDSLDNYIRANDARVQDALDSIGTVATEVEKLKGRVKALENSLPGIDARLDTLEKNVAKIMPRLKAVEEKVKELEGRVEKLENRLNSLITNIIVQQAHNPIFGSINLPWGNSNLLMAFYGSATNLGVEFPTYKEEYFFDGVATVTKKDVAVFKGEKFTKPAYYPLYLDKEGNAGYLYVTVNPTDVDFTGTKFSLVTSQEKEIVTLGNLQKTNDELKFGWTRAEVASKASNGLYKASVTIDEKKFAQAAPRVNLNVDNVKDALKEVAASAKSKNISTIAQSLVKAGVAVSPLAETNFPAYAVKAAWKPEGGQPTAVYSKYEIGAIAVKPMSYAFAQGVKSEKVPGLSVLEGLVNNALSVIKKMIPTDFFTLLGTTSKDMIFDLDRVDVDKLGLEQIDEDKFLASFYMNVKLDTTINLQKLDIKGKIPELTIPKDKLSQDVTFNGVTDKLVFTEDLKFTPTGDVTVEGKDIVIKFERIIDLREDVKPMVGTLNSVRSLMQYLEGYLGKVNDMIVAVDQLDDTIGDKVDALSDKVISYLDKVNDLLLPYMCPNDWLQPILLGSANGFVRFTTSTHENPQLINSTELTLIPTTRTVELLSPAFKKWIAVTDVFQGTKSAKGGNGACVAARTKANSASQINEVIDGDVRVVKLSLEKNYTYEIVYQALDYTGRVAAKRYYVRVK